MEKKNANWVLKYRTLSQRICTFNVFEFKHANIWITPWNSIQWPNLICVKRPGQKQLLEHTPSTPQLPLPWMIKMVSTLWRDIYRWHIPCSRIPAQSWFWQLSSQCMSDPLSDSPTCSWCDWQVDFCCSCACCHYSSRISRQK